MTRGEGNKISITYSSPKGRCEHSVSLAAWASALMWSLASVSVSPSAAPADSEGVWLADMQREQAPMAG